MLRRLLAARSIPRGSRQPPRGEEILGQLIDVSELVVPVRALASLQLLAGALQTTAQEAEELCDGGVTDGVTRLSQLLSESTGRFCGPPQW